MSDEELGAYIKAMEDNQHRMGDFITRLAFALDIHEEWGGGFAEERILDRINELKEKAA